MHTASQALAIERQASAQPSLAERVSRPKTRAILGLMRLNFLSVFMRGAFTTIWDVAQAKKVSLRTATFIVACQRILHAREMRGLYP